MTSMVSLLKVKAELDRRLELLRINIERSIETFNEDRQKYQEAKTNDVENEPETEKNQDVEMNDFENEPETEKNQKVKINTIEIELETQNFQKVIVNYVENESETKKYQNVKINDVEYESETEETESAVLEKRISDKAFRKIKRDLNRKVNDLEAKLQGFRTKLMAAKRERETYNKKED